MWLENLDYRLNNLNYITDTKWKLVKMELLEWQKKVLEALKKHKRVVWLKSRQEWWTTFWSALCKDMITFIPNYNALLLAHRQDVQQEALRKVKLMHTTLVNKWWDKQQIFDWKVLFNIPKDVSNNADTISFNNNSQLKISLDPTWKTYQHIHFSEMAKNTKAEQVFQDGISALNEWTSIVESTAFWKSWTWKWFFDFYSDSMKWLTWFYPVFTPWWGQKRYSHKYKWKPFPKDVEFYRKFLKDYDVETQNNKLQWYYDLKTQTFKDKMPREYPAYWEEAFMESVTSYFDVIRLKWLMELSEYLEYKFDDKFPKKVIKWIEEWLKIYRKPTKQCVISIDPAWWTENWDYTALICRDLEHNLLFSYYWKAWPDEVLNILFRVEKLGYIWLLVPEINATNWWSVFTLIKINIKNRKLKSKLYEREKSDEDIKNNKPTKYGWETNTKTRKIIIENFNLYFNRWVIDEVDDRQLYEMSSFIEDTKGKPIADTGSHDDLILADCICNYVIVMFPYTKLQKNTLAVIKQ